MSRGQEPALDVVGGKRKPVIILTLENGSLRYSEIAHRMTRITESMLVRRLPGAGAGRPRDPDRLPGSPAQSGVNALTTAGRKLIPALRVVSLWSACFLDEKSAGSRLPPVVWRKEWLVALRNDLSQIRDDVDKQTGVPRRAAGAQKRCAASQVVKRIGRRKGTSTVPVLVRFPPVQHIAAFDKDQTVLLCIGFRTGFGKGITGLIVQHLADRDRWRDTGHPGERDRELGLAVPLVEQVVSRTQKGTVARVRKNSLKCAPPQSRDFFTSSAIAVIVSASPGR